MMVAVSGTIRTRAAIARGPWSVQSLSPPAASIQANLLVSRAMSPPPRQSESRPIERIGGGGIAQRRALRYRQRLRFAVTRGQFAVEVRHERRGRPVRNGPQRGQHVARAGVQERLDESHPVVTRRDVRQRAGAKRSLTGGEHDEARAQLETKHVVDFESTVSSRLGRKINEREEGVVFVEDAVGGEMNDAL